MAVRLVLASRLIRVVAVALLLVWMSRLVRAVAVALATTLLLVTPLLRVAQR